MKQNEADRLAFNLAVKFGLPLHATLNQNGQEIYLEPTGMDFAESFKIRISVGWRSLIVDLMLGKFAADLLEQMSNTNAENRNIFSAIARHIFEERGSLDFKLNDTPINVLHTESWPDKWNSLTLLLKKSPLEINTEDHRLTEELTYKWVERFYALVMILAPLEEINTSEKSLGLPEGALKRQLVNRYERSRINRAMCINFHGCVCKVCDMDFASIYGKMGDGFIHVHHVIPVSRLGEGYIINPIDDLIPVCPNCHAMLHKKDPPYTVDELKSAIAANL